MKTFLMNISRKWHDFKTITDVKSILCDKLFYVFNDDKHEIIYIFKNDNSLLITDNGVVLNASWEFVTANNTLIIKTTHTSIMFHPLLIDNLLFALQQSGTDKYMMMIDDKKVSTFKEISMDGLNCYLLEAERTKKKEEEQRIEADKEKEKRREIETKYKNQIKRIGNTFTINTIIVIALDIIIVLIIIWGLSIINKERITDVLSFIISILLTFIQVFVLVIISFNITRCEKKKEQFIQDKMNENNISNN